MKKMIVPKPVSAGIILSYKCNSRCRHCMYACSPEWRSDWITEDDLKTVLGKLSNKILPSPLGPNAISINYGLHLTGGEPFLNFNLLLKAAEIANELGIPSTFVETNCFWAVDESTAEARLAQLKEKGLKGILVSVNPFILEYVPFERTERVIKAGRHVFGANVIVYQEDFLDQFRQLDVKGTMLFEEYLLRAGSQGFRYVELIPMGRAAYSLAGLYRRFPARQFFGESCLDSILRRWHVHTDNYGNYMAGYCGGISLGAAKELDSMFEGIDLEEMPIVNALATDIRKLYQLATEEFGYRELVEGYISKCHLCLDIRRHIAKLTGRFKELSPREFYLQLS